MDHTDHMNLLRGGIEAPGGVWADLGAGSGAFTLALAELLGGEATIYAIDRSAGALRENLQAMESRFPGVDARYEVADFTAPLVLPPLAGIVMANSLHFQRNQQAAVRRARGYLREGGRMIVVEYNIEHGNPAVPFPVPYARWVELAHAAGFGETRLLARRPSRFLREIYSAVSW